MWSLEIFSSEDKCFLFFSQAFMEKKKNILCQRSKFVDTPKP